MGSISTNDTLAKRRSLVEWLNSLFPGLDIPLEASEEEIRVLLSDGTVLCGILNQQDPGFLANQRCAYMSSEPCREKVRRFLLAIEEMGLPLFAAGDLEHGPISAVVDCLLAVRDRLSFEYSEGDIHVISNSGKQAREKWIKTGNCGDSMNAAQGNHIQMGKNSSFREDKKMNFSEKKSDLHVPAISEPSTSSLNHEGHKFREVFQLMQGHFSDIPATKFSEIMRSNGLDNVPTQSLLSAINRILTDSIEKKNEEIPHPVASLLQKVMQEIERRFSMQAEHIRNQNHFIKAREEKYKSRIRLIETLRAGTTEEIQIASNQLRMIKGQKTQIEERCKQVEQYSLKLIKEKEDSDQVIIELKQGLETAKNTYEDRCQQLKIETKQNEARLQERIKEVELLLSASTKRINELEAFSESKFQSWNQKENVFYNFVSSQLQSVKSLKISSESIRLEVVNSQRDWREEMSSMGVRLKGLADAAENYHTVLAENRKLYNEVQELKGNIRVYCRIRPFLRGQNSKLTTIDYIGENGELVLVNPSRQGKDSHRMFKFNKVFGPTASQAQVFLDIQPLIRSVLDGYNVCIFAYGQTGSGKTFTMSGPNISSEEEWGVNYRALSDLFHMSHVRRNAFTYEVGVQMVEIYNEQVRDLLSNNGSQKRYPCIIIGFKMINAKWLKFWVILLIKVNRFLNLRTLGIWSISQPHGLVVPDASMFIVKSTSDVLELMQFGQTNRAVGSTALNERSSRSHSILTVHVRGVDLKTGSTSRGCLHLIDLAGSERVDRSKATGDRLKEAQHINKSLSALGDVIFALSQKSAHVPYRNSKLTQVLQSSLGGQAKTLMFVQVNPDVESCSETLSTLMFAERVSGVELGAAKSNKEGKDIKDLVEQVTSLKDTIARKDEEIEQLQLLKDQRSESPESNSLRKASSSPSVISSIGGLSQLGSGKVAKFAEKHVRCNADFSEFSNRNSGAGSLLPMFNGGKAAEHCNADDETVGSVDEDSDGMSSDVSGGDPSIGEEAEYFMGGALESAILSESGRPSAVMIEKIPKPPQRIAKLLAQRTSRSLSTRAKSSDSLKSLVPKKSTSGQVASSSSAKQMKR
ncbi:hypothetical protein KFK09_025839 [Dendrobium nobile]|uniref:Uncharacterized protein n=1 Tax=Dendrobium nobile TaxID=94219 RepID=A0A8T3A692_DENNO|nr:hypothetical protein KFK09_025839 [Dendrobium nobile]